MTTSPRADHVQSIDHDTPREASPRWALASLALSMLMPSLDTSIANAALPTLADAFGASFQQVQWIVLAYLLVVTSLIVGVGRLGDAIGRRRLLLVGIVAFTAASLACGLSRSLPMMLAARTAQGLGGAVMMALAVASVGDVVPKARIGSAMGLLGTVSAIGTTLGPTLAGVLIGGLGWRAIFLVNVPVGIAALVLTRQYVPADRLVRNQGRPRLDAPGTLVLASTLAAYALALTLGRGSFGPLNVALLAAAVCGVVVFVMVEARTPSPLIRMAVFRDPRLTVCLARNGLVSTVMMATLVVGPFYLSRGLGLVPTVVGLVLSIGPLVAAVGSAAAGHAVDRFGAPRMAIVGLVGLAAGASALAILPVGLGVAGYLTPVVVMTASYAVFQAANGTAIISEVRAEERGVIAGLLSLSRNLGLITGASAMGAVFAHAAGAGDLATTGPEAIATGLRVTFAVAAALVVTAIGITAAGAAAESSWRRVVPWSGRRSRSGRSGSGPYQVGDPIR